MDWIFNTLISFIASTVGAICGIGGGIIIKPALDAAGIVPPVVTHFLSGCTVLIMTAYSVLRAKLSGDSLIEINKATPIAIGAAVGGIVGKQSFQILQNITSSSNNIYIAQSIILSLLSLGALLYNSNKEKLRTKELSRVKNYIFAGLALGGISSFLGIGGGPLNLIVLYYFFGMDIKTAVQNSLYIILFSQLASLFITFATNSVPSFPVHMLVLMMFGGLSGGVVGGIINKKINKQMISTIFNCLLVVIVLINIFNIMKYVL